MKKSRKLKKALALVLFCAILTVSVLSVGVSAYTTFGPFTTAKLQGAQMMYYKYTTGIDVGTTINRTLDGSNYISKISMGSTYAKIINTYACIYSGTKDFSIFSEDLFNYPDTNLTINKGEIVVGVSAVYYPSGADAISLKTEKETSTNKVSVQKSITTSSALTSYGGIEYRYSSNNALYAFLTTPNF